MLFGFLPTPPPYSKSFGPGWRAGGGGCRRYIESQPLLAKVRTALPLLMKPLSTNFVMAAPKLLKAGSSAGVDCMPAELYQQFSSVFFPRMEEAMKPFLLRGAVVDSWSVSLMKCIPKFAHVVQAQDMCPIALQNAVLKKWSGSPRQSK